MEEKGESLETVQARHRKEQRDLQSRITSKKKNATKKTRKGVNDECAQLEQQLRERQQQELAVLNGEAATTNDDTEQEGREEGDLASHETNGMTEHFQQTSISESAPIVESEQQSQQPGKKRNRQKDRLARRAAEQEAAALAAEEEAAHMTDHRQIEKTYMLKEFKTHGLAEKEIQPDGHCLFSAVADQLGQYSIPLAQEIGSEKEKKELPYQVVRKRATDYMRAHEDDFAPFMEDDFGTYVSKIRDTAEWGGQLELMALARSYGVEIKVVQEQRTETIDPGEEALGGEGEGEGERKRIWLAYYRHGYGLGEHYNSLRKASP
ncbi:otu domain-containing protein 6b protein [Apiospora kogelbergensis]|uniref:Otu domain-containing protein 6b protein n=1 Tax=Apiospora kogelbergensis TaxID=1337665 RepID=A0AAW0QQ97_9PEZI